MIFSLYEYELEFSTPLPLKGVFQKTRKGALLELKGKESFFAEASPLPFYSKETLEMAVQQIISVAKDLHTDLWKQEKLFPSVHFALECLFRKRLEEHSFAICNYLQGNQEELLLQFETYRNSKHVKIKLGIFSPKKALELLNKAFQIFGKDTLFRIDINQMWTLLELKEFCNQVCFEKIEFIEEPLKDPFQLDLIGIGAKIFALDESIRSYPLTDLLQIKNINALVIKPTLDSCLLFTKEFKSLVEKHKLNLVFSSCYESNVGLSHISLLAEELSSTCALGIDTGKLFKKPLEYKKIYEHTF